MADRTDTYTFPDGRRVEIDTTYGEPPTFVHRVDGKIVKDPAKIQALIDEARAAGFAQPEPKPVEAPDIEDTDPSA